MSDIPLKFWFPQQTISIPNKITNKILSMNIDEIMSIPTTKIAIQYKSEIEFEYQSFLYMNLFSPITYKTIYDEALELINHRINSTFIDL